MENYKMKKAQLNQVFTIIFSLIIMSFVVFLFINVIVDVNEKKCKAQQIEFDMDIKNIITGRYKEYGTVEKHIVFAPCNAQLLCFIDSKTNYTFDESNNLFPANFPLFLRRVVNGYHNGNNFSKNIFTYDNQFAQDIGFYETVRVLNDNKIVCVEKKGNKFEFITNGLGKEIEIIASPNMFENAILTSFSEPQQISGDDGVEMNIYIDVNKFNAVLTETEIKKIASNDIENIEYVKVEEDNGRVVYTFKGKGYRNLFGIIPLPMTLQSKITSDGEGVGIDGEWWKFVTTD